jgi:hypothetical protein
MSLSLVEALTQVDLEAGRVYFCEVNGHKVELRVLETAESESLSALDESDVMLDPWVEFPRPTSRIVLRAKPGPIRLPDVPVLPVDEECE